MSERLFNGYTLRELKKRRFEYRRRYRRGTLSTERIRLLEELPGWSWVIKSFVRKSPAEWIQIAEALAAKQRDRMLPSPTQLCKKGLGALAAAMRQRPKLFSHIPQRSFKGKTPEEWVTFAEQLAAKQADKKLPLWGELVKKGLHGFGFAVHKHPKLFAHIPQRDAYKERKAAALARDLAIYPKLVRQCGNHRPAYGWLRAPFSPARRKNALPSYPGH